MKINWDELKLGISMMNRRQAIALLVGIELLLCFMAVTSQGSRGMTIAHEVWLVVRYLVFAGVVGLVVFMLRDRKKP